MTQDLLKEAFIRNIALVLPAGIKGADMVIPVLLPDNSFSCVVLQIKNLDDTKLAGLTDKLSPKYLNFLDLTTRSSADEPAAKNAKQMAEYLPLIIQFSPPISAETKVKTFSVVKHADNNCVQMLGLKAFEHLFGSQGNTLQSLINGEFHFVNYIDDDKQSFIPSQSKKDAFETRLNSMNPVANKAHLALSNDNYREVNPSEADLVDKKLKSAGIKRNPNQP